MPREKTKPYRVQVPVTTNGYAWIAGRANTHGATVASVVRAALAVAAKHQDEIDAILKVQL